MQEFAQKSVTRKKGVSLKDLEATEEVLNKKLDQQYQELLQIVNAPEFGEWQFYPIKEPQNLRKTFDDVVRNTQIAHQGGFSEEMIAIAENGTGNFLCMLSGHPEVYLQDHEKEKPEVVASDLKNFIEKAETID